VSDDQVKERKEERPEEVEAHKFHEPEVQEESDVEGHVLEKNDYKEMKE
jgi:hypothetical protein